MKKPALAALVVAGLLVVGGVGFALFERHERSGLAARAELACEGRDEVEQGTPADLPLALPAPEGGTLTKVAEQGSTQIAFVKVPGDRDDLVRVRDAVLEDLTGSGYEVVGKDQEPGYEAEAEVSGPHDGTVKVTPLCEGQLQVRYAVSE
ncbi:MAG: hypothetical protein JWO60_2600 [Frankiales bacterium]|nr:hypothetical protein [Frankiales bacterium]